MRSVQQAVLAASDSKAVRGSAALLRGAQNEGELTEENKAEQAQQRNPAQPGESSSSLSETAPRNVAEPRADEREDVVRNGGGSTCIATGGQRRSFDYLHDRSPRKRRKMTETAMSSTRIEERMEPSARRWNRKWLFRPRFGQFSHVCSSLAYPALTEREGWRARELTLRSTRRLGSEITRVSRRGKVGKGVWHVTHQPASIRSHPSSLCR